MNSVYIFFQRLGQYLQKNRLVFGLFILGGIVNTIAVLYCYGNLLPVVANHHSQKSQYTAYTVTLDSAPAKLQDVERLAESPFVKACTFTDGSGLYSYDEEYPLTRLSGSLVFTGPYQIIVPAMDAAVGDTVSYNGTEFEVIGVATTSTKMSFIPYETYLKVCDVENITRVHLHAAQRQNLDSDQITALVEAYLPQHDSISGSAYALQYTEKVESQRFFWIIIINAFLAVVAHILLLHYLLDSIRAENVISIFLGASKGTIAAFVLRDGIALCAAANGMGILIHSLLYDAVFAQLNLNLNIRYNPGDYCLVYLIMLVLSLIAVIPAVVKVVSASPVSVGRRIW